MFHSNRLSAPLASVSSAPGPSRASGRYAPSRRCAMAYGHPGQLRRLPSNRAYPGRRHPRATPDRASPSPGKQQAHKASNDGCRRPEGLPFCCNTK